MALLYLNLKSKINQISCQVRICSNSHNFYERNFHNDIKFKTLIKSSRIINYDKSFKANQVCFSSHQHQQKQDRQSLENKNPLILCLLGFSLRELLGEEEAVPEGAEEDAQLILMIKKGILAFYVSIDYNYY